MAPDKYLIYDVMFEINLIHAPNAILSPFMMCSCKPDIVARGNIGKILPTDDIIGYVQDNGSVVSY